MARTARIVKTPFKFDGKFRQVGDTIHVTDGEAEAYAAHLDGDGYVPGEAYLPGQEPQPRGPIDPLTEAQAVAGDRLAQDQIARAESGYTEPEGRGDIADEATETSAYETKEAAATSTRPMAAAKPKK